VCAKLTYMHEYKETTILCLRTSADKIMNTTFVTVLGPDSLFSIKLPTNLDKYRYANQISPLYLLDVELVKTKTNWVLKGIVRFELLAEPRDYAAVMAVSQIVKTLLQYVREDQETDVLAFVAGYIRTGLDVFDGVEFEARLLEKLGFAGRRTSTMQEQGARAKVENDLRGGEYLPKKDLGFSTDA
jgi:hypothetical protein